MVFFLNKIVTSDFRCLRGEDMCDSVCAHVCDGYRFVAIFGFDANEFRLLS